MQGVSEMLPFCFQNSMPGKDAIWLVWAWFLSNFLAKGATENRRIDVLSYTGYKYNGNFNKGYKGSRHRGRSVSG